MLEKLLDITRRSGAIIQDHWRKPRQAIRKGPVDLVTRTDVAVEEFLMRNLKDLAPGVGFLAEESASEKDGIPEGDCWIIDPVDGTTNFVHGIPTVGTSVALWSGGRVEMGVVNMPMLGQCFHAARGRGAWEGGRRLRVSSVSRLNEAVIATGFPYDIPVWQKRIIDWMAAVLPAAQGVRRMGAASVDLAFVADGRMDAYYEAALKPWDVAAGWLLVEEAGGRVSDLEGRPGGFCPVVLASNGLIHEDLRMLLVRPNT